jgi:hypothetical protein
MTNTLPKINPKIATCLVNHELADKLVNKSFPEAINQLQNYYLLLPCEIVDNVEDFIIRNKNLGIHNKEEFFSEAGLWRLKSFNDDIETLEFSKEIMDQTRSAIEDLDMPFKDVHDFILEQMNRLHEHHENWKQQKEVEDTTMAQSNS